MLALSNATSPSTSANPKTVLFLFCFSTAIALLRPTEYQHYSSPHTRVTARISTTTSTKQTLNRPRCMSTNVLMIFLTCMISLSRLLRSSMFLEVVTSSVFFRVLLKLGPNELAMGWLQDVKKVIAFQFVSMQLLQPYPRCALVH